MDDFTIDQLVIFAARSGNLELLKSRIGAGGNVNYIDKKHGTALIVAIMSKNIEVLEILLANNANVNVEYRDCIGPLEIALRNPNVEIVYRLVCAGAKLKHTTRPYYRERLTQCLKEINLKNKKDGGKK